MTFTSIYFLPCFLILMLALAVTKKEKLRQAEILLASAAFYAVWDVRLLLLLLGCVLVAFVVGRVISSRYQSQKEHNGKYLAICISVLLIVLGVFKYYNFFISGVESLFHIKADLTIKVLLPVGISFYIFSCIGLMIDVYRREIEERLSFFEVAFYVLFFPKLLQGPLHKASDFLAQLKKEHPVTWQNISEGIQIFLFGLIKKVVIADRLGVFVDTVYSVPQAYDGPTLLLVVLTYPLQLYCDFSGYSDMAVGTAKLMGYDVCENFNIPFAAKSVAEYWRRWHISLNIWFRDYLFYSIIRSNWVNRARKSMKKKSKHFSKILPSIIGMAIVWPLVGLWHGAALNYIVYGACYGVLMIGGSLIGEYKKKGAWEGKGWEVFRLVRTWLITVVLLLLFRVSAFSEIAVVLKGIFTWQRGINYIYFWSLIYIVLVMVSVMVAYKRNNGNGYYILLDLGKFRNKVALCTTALMTIVLMYVGENYFMYFQF